MRQLRFSWSGGRCDAVPKKKKQVLGTVAFIPKRTEAPDFLDARETAGSILVITRTLVCEGVTSVAEVRQNGSTKHGYPQKALALLEVGFLSRAQ